MQGPGRAAVSFCGAPNVLPAGSKLKSSYRLGAPVAMTRHLVVEKIAPTPQMFSYINLADE